STLLICLACFIFFFVFNAHAPPEIYTLSLHDALPISSATARIRTRAATSRFPSRVSRSSSATDSASVSASSSTEELLKRPPPQRSEEHTSELQSRSDLVCRLLLEKKKTTNKTSKPH